MWLCCASGSVNTEQRRLLVIIRLIRLLGIAASLRQFLFWRKDRLKHPLLGRLKTQVKKSEGH